MINVMPDFYGRFKCTASACTDNCCIGWEVDIDDGTLNKYKALSSPFAKELNESYTVSPDNCTCFRLTKDKRCIHLDENNLCRIIKTEGETMLCDICREHPRFYNDMPGAAEAGLGLCCEEVCRLLFLNKKGFKLTVDDDGREDFDESDEKALYTALFNIRQSLFDIVFAEGIPYGKKTAAVRETAARYDREIFLNDNENTELPDDGKLCALMAGTEAIDENWLPLVKKIENKLACLTEAEPAYDKECGFHDCELVLAYTLYRHFIVSFDDGEILAHTDFCLKFTRFYKLMNLLCFTESGTLTDENRINNLKYLSKQTEYSDENTDLLTFTEY